MIPIFNLKYLIPSVIAFALTACSDSGDIPQPVRKDSPRTILVYMVADNSLGDYYDNADMNEMRVAAANGDLGDSRWIVYHHARNGNITLEELHKNGFDTLRTYSSDVASVSIERMKAVIADVKRLAPSPAYGIVLWSHSSGWPVDGMIESRSFGDDSGRRMNISSLREALAGEGFDYIYADCCNMACVEVAYELRDAADYFVASTAEIPGQGMPYHKTLKYLVGSTPDLVSASRETFEYYNSMPASSGAWCTQSVIDLNRISALAEATRKIYQSSEYPSSYVPQRLGGTPCLYYDFKHFINAMAADSEEFNSALSDAVLYADHTSHIICVTGETIKVDYHCGLSTYILQNESSALTKNYQATQWYNDVARYQPLSKR